MTHVLVVGAGPTGLALACELHRHAVPCRVVDQRAVHVDRSRAVDVQSRTLDALEAIGVADAVIERGRRLSGFSIYDGPRKLARLAYRAEGVPHPYAVALPQATTEELLSLRLEALGGRVDRGVRLVALAEHGSDVEVTLRGARTIETARASYVVGCDGVASTVREAAGVRYEARAPARSFVTADATLDWSLPPDEQALFLADQHCLLALPLPGERRVRLIADTAEGADRPDDLESFSRLASERLGAEVRLHTPGFVSTYHVQRRLAELFVCDRVLIAGDAAHSFNPIGGHGMNQGIQDAHNLGWKLALVVRGLAGDDLLASYHVERRGAAVRFAREMDFQARLQLARQDVPAADLDRLLDFAVKSPTLRRAVLDAALPGVADYDDSPIVREHVAEGCITPADVAAGRYAPDARLDGGSLRDHLRDTRHTLLLMSGAARGVKETLVRAADELDKAWSDVVRVTLVAARSSDRDAWPGSVVVDGDGELHRRYGAVEPSAYLVRPDGHIGFRACPFSRDAVARHAKWLFGR